MVCTRRFFEFSFNNNAVPAKMQTFKGWRWSFLEPDR